MGEGLFIFFGGRGRYLSRFPVNLHKYVEILFFCLFVHAVAFEHTHCHVFRNMLKYEERSNTMQHKKIGGYWSHQSRVVITAAFLHNSSTNH